MTDKTQSEAAVVADIVRDLIKAESVVMMPGMGESVQAFALPSGISLHSVKKYIDEWRTEPERRQGTAQIDDLDSLIRHASRFMNEDSALFARRDRKHPSLTASIRA